MKPSVPQIARPSPPAAHVPETPGRPKIEKPGDRSGDPFLPEVQSPDYEHYVRAATTARLTPYINGRNSNRGGPDIFAKEAFDAMENAVEATQAGDEVYLAAWGFGPKTPLTAGQANKRRTWGVGRTWGELFRAKALQGVRVRILMNEFDPVLPALHDGVNAAVATLDELIDGLPHARRTNLQYLVSLHPLRARVLPGVTVGGGSHHQKMMVIRRSGETIAFCGGLDIDWLRTPPDWKYDDQDDPERGVWQPAAWHDLHVKVEGLLALDLARNFAERWNRETGNNPRVPPRADWNGAARLTAATASSLDAAPERNLHKGQMHRTVSRANPKSTRDDPPQETLRDDVWQGYVKIVDCAEQFLYIEQQYYRDLRLADQIIARSRRAGGLIVIAVVPAKTDDVKDFVTEHGNRLEFRFFGRLTKALGERLRVYTMESRFVHSKMIMADDRMMSIGSTNANPRGFLVDTEQNVAVADETLVSGFRSRLWQHNLGVPEARVATWPVSAFFARWDEVTQFNAKVIAGKDGKDFTDALPNAAGECVLPWDYKEKRGSHSRLVRDELT